ncbi:FAR1 DNA binding domain, zinc finger, SWIM-type, MULE transposase domain containing protein [Tanacetum coccineum]
MRRKHQAYTSKEVFISPVTVEIKNPNKCPNKGHRRFKGAAEKGKAITNRKVPFKQLECSKCGQEGHNKRTCDEKRFPGEEYQAKKRASEHKEKDATDKYDEDEDDD